MDQNNPTHPILEEIDAYCDARGVAESTFGALAVGDPRLVSTLRKGREPRRAMLQQIRLYMLTGQRPTGKNKIKEGTVDVASQ